MEGETVYQNDMRVDCGRTTWLNVWRGSIVIETQTMQIISNAHLSTEPMPSAYGRPNGPKPRNQTLGLEMDP